MANQSRRQFVWSRVAGTIGGGLGDGLFGTDLLANTREQFGDAVLRGATVMGIRGYIRPNGTSPAGISYVAYRSAVRVGYGGDVDGPATEVRQHGPFFASHSDWMLWQQAMFVATDTDNNGVATSNIGGSAWAVETRAARKLAELGETLTLYVDAQSPVGTPFNEFFSDFDLSIGLKLP